MLLQTRIKQLFQNVISLVLEKTWKKLLFQICFLLSCVSFILSGHMGQCDPDNQKSMLDRAQNVTFEVVMLKQIY